VLTKALAQELGRRIYQWVGLTGTARWSIADYSLQEFSVDRITEYEDLSLANAMSELGRVIGRYFDDVEDVETYVAEIRGESDRVEE
jgi:hypothetical protein